jgi:hypothetical protein
MIPSFLSATPPNVTWVHVERPKLDLVGIVLGAFGLAGALALLALGLGVGLGAVLILRRRRRQVSIGDGVLHLEHAGVRGSPTPPAAPLSS